MNKVKRFTIGSVVKNKDTSKGDYIKISNDVTLKKGDILRLETKKEQLANIANAVKKGKLSDEVAAKLTEQANRTPDFVRFNVYQLKEE